MRKRQRTYRRSYRPAPVNRMNKVWVPAGIMQENGSPGLDPSLVSDSGSISRIVSWSAAGLKTLASGLLGSVNEASCKLLRIDGQIELFFNPIEEVVNWAEFDHVRIRYVWYRSKLAPNAIYGAESQLTSTAGPLDQINEWMRRKDVLRQGTIHLYGSLPDWESPMPYVQNAGTPGGSVASTQERRFVNPRTNPNPRPCHLPLPRLPKGGLNLGEGEALECFVQAYSLTDNVGTDHRNVWAQSQARLLLTK